MTYAIQAVEINGTQRSGITGYFFEQTREIDSEASDGTVHETLHVDTMNRPQARLTTLAVHTLLGLTTNADAPFIALDGVNGLKMFGAEAASDAPGFASGTTHMSKTGTDGIIAVARLSWSRGGNLEAELDALFKSSNGTTASVTESTSESAPSLPDPTEKLTLQTLTLNGADVQRVASTEHTIDHRFVQEFDTGLPYPVEIYGAGVNGPVVHRATAEIEDVEIGEGTGAATFVYVTRAQGGGVGASTVTLTYNARWSLEESWGGQQGAPMTRRLVIRPRKSGATAPVTISVA